MRRSGRSVLFASALAFVLLAPAVALAQSAIAGVVKDTTGAVLPGVTVEASSAALIEGSRTVTTDEAGLYRIIDLRPGTYVITFTLPGFNSIRREGIELPSGFTATVNADLKVGAVEETVTVTGESPVVDVKSATTQQVMTRDLLDAVPTGRNIWAVGSTLTGITLSAPDVGGTAGMQQTYMAVHGSNRADNAIQVDGMSVNGIEGDGAIQNYFNDGMFQEMSYQTSALTAEVQASGVRLNMIPKDGGNTFKGSLFISRTPGAWQSDNFTDELRQKGLQAPNRVEKIHDFNPGFGGPIAKDHLWFFTSFRRWGVDQTVTDSFYNLDPKHLAFVPANGQNGRELKPTVDDNIIKSGVVRLTWQIAQKHKFAGYIDRIVKFRGHECTTNTFPTEEACSIRSPKRYFTLQGKYTATLTSRLLVEGGFSENDETYSTGEAQPSVGPTDIPRFDRNTTDAWGAPQAPYYFRVPDRYTYTAAASYVTGTHAFRSGMQLSQGGNRHQRSLQGDVNLIQEYRLNATTGVRAPASVVVYNTPMEAKENIKYDLGLYVQDSWTLSKWTINPGVRFELFNTYIPKEGSPPGRFVPAREYGPIYDLPNWRDVAPRFGAVYDVTGDGKTAVKMHVGKYMRAFSTVGFAQVYNPLRQETDRRTWTDLNRDDIAQDNEIGPVNTPFNTTGALNRVPDPNIKRPYQWEYSVGIQREVIRGLSLSANWVRRDYSRIFWTDNVQTTFDDYTIIQTPNPLNPSEMIPIYNLNRAKLGQVSQIDKNSDVNKKWYNGYDVGFTARIHGGNVYGGVSSGRQITVACEVDDPNSLRFCDQRDLGIPYLTQFKISGTYPLPYGVQVSGNWQGYPGVPSGTNRQDGDYTAAANRVIDPSLNVNYNVTPAIIPTLTVASVQVPLLTPGTKYLDRWNQVDVRLAKKFRLHRVNFQGQLDIFNILNASSILSANETYGPSLDRPTSILQGRLLAVGAQMNF
jgi:Carboxypeptidase regulatory-like domain